MKITLIIFLILVGCSSIGERELKEENQLLQKKVDSLKNQLHNCDMLIQAYENDPLNI